MNVNKLLVVASLTLFTAASTPLLADNNVTDARYAKMLDDLLSHTVNEVDVQQAVDMPSAIFIDAREKPEYMVSHIKGAIWAGYDDFDLGRLTSLSSDQTIVVYCSVGYRSEKITEQLMQAGYTNTTNLYGGIFEWVNQGKNIVNTEGQTTNVHAFNRKWSQWLKAGNKVYD